MEMISTNMKKTNHVNNYVNKKIKNINLDKNVLR